MRPNSSSRTRSTRLRATATTRPNNIPTAQVIHQLRQLYVPLAEVASLLTFD